MKIQYRRFLAAGFILIFIITAPILIMHGSGFRYNFKKWSWQKTGSLYIKTIPNNSEIYINDIKNKKNTPTTINSLYPNIYNIKIKKSGYKNWEKNIIIEPEILISIDNLFLIPEKIERINEIISAPQDSPLHKANGVFSFNTDLWKFDLTKNIIPQYVISENTTTHQKFIANYNNPDKLIFTIPDAITEIIKIDKNFAIFQNQSNDLLIGKIQDNNFEISSTVKKISNYFWDEKKFALTVSANLDLMQFKFTNDKIEKNLILRISDSIDNFLIIPDTDYIFILQTNQIKIIESNSTGTEIDPIFSLLSDERLVYWEITKKSTLTIYTQKNDTLEQFDLEIF